MKLSKCEKCESVTINVDEKSGICEVCYYRIPLLQLLSVIHDDPNNKYVDVAGVSKASHDAMIKHVFLQERDRV